MAYRRIWFRPRILRNVAHIDFSTSILGSPTRMPVYVAATALGGLYHPNGELELSQGCNRANIIQMFPRLSSTSMSAIAEHRGEKQTHWFQLYTDEDRRVAQKDVERAESLGFKALAITVDTAQLGNRERDKRIKSVGLSAVPKAQSEEDDHITKEGITSYIDPSLNWNDIPWFQSLTKMPILLKGIQTGEDAVMAAQSGVEGIIISNHGGRQLDFSRSPIEVLEEVMGALKAANVDLSKFEVLIDGGIRRGTDIFKAIALGAKAVGIGRPVMYALSAFGQEGVERLFDLLESELTMCMRLMGAPTLSHITRDMIITKNLSDHTVPVARNMQLDENYEPLPTVLTSSTKSKL